MTRDRGGIGRHAGLRSQWANACGGSSPLDRTISLLPIFPAPTWLMTPFGSFSANIIDMFTFYRVTILLMCGLRPASPALADTTFTSPPTTTLVHPPLEQAGAPGGSGELAPPNKRVGEVYDLVYQIKTATDAQAPKASYGSSFVVGKDGLLATNFHVVASALFEPERYHLYLVEGEQAIEAKVVAFDAVNDLALVQVNREFPRVSILAPGKPHVGSRIYSIGFPEDLNKSIIEGNFNGIVTEGPYQKLQMSIPLNPGMSGGPTVDEAGRLIGINVSLQMDSQSLAFAVPAALLRQLLKKPKMNFFGPNARKMFDEETRQQMEDVQEELTKIFMQGRREPVKMQEWASERPGQFLKCWRESEVESRNLSQTTTESCYFPNGSTLKSDVDLGTFRLRFQVISGQGLNTLQFLAKVNDSIHRYNLDTVDYMDGFTTKFHCEEVDLVNASAVPLRVNYCFNGYLKYPGLYNLELRAVTLTKQRSLFQVQASLSGFSATNALEVGQKIVDSIHLEP